MHVAMGLHLAVHRERHFVVPEVLQKVGAEDWVAQLRNRKWLWVPGPPPQFAQALLSGLTLYFA